MCVYIYNYIYIIYIYVSIYISTDIGICLLYNVFTINKCIVYYINARKYKVYHSIDIQYDVNVLKNLFDSQL